MRVSYTPTYANFVWFDTGKESKAVFQALLREGVIIRTGDIFGAPTHLRVTIGTPEENAKFLNALRVVLSRL
jgi:histidinol-phosphate aminotransferase